MKWIDYTALTIVILGAINWFLIGVFHLNVITYLFQDGSWTTRILYTLIGLCGLYLVSFYGRVSKMPN